MEGRAWGSGYTVRIRDDEVWVRSVREIALLLQSAGVQVSASKVHAMLAQADDRAAGRPVTRRIRPLPAFVSFRAVGTIGERESARRAK